MDAVGADQNVRFVDHLRSGFAVMEATPDPSVNLLERGEGVTATAERAAARGEPWLSLFDPAELCELLRREGFKIVEDLGLPEIAERLYGDLRRDIRVGAGPHIVRANRNR